jgi:hypothetical protein
MKRYTVFRERPDERANGGYDFEAVGWRRRC